MHAREGDEGAEGDQDQEEAQEESPSRITDEFIPIIELPPRPRTLLELGAPFMHPGDIGKGFEIPTGAVWAPSLIFYGSRTLVFLGVFQISQTKKTG